MLVAETVAAPAALTERPSEAVALWFATVTATEAPTAAVELVTSPLAVVVADAVCVASTSSTSSSAISSPVPMLASVETLETATATAGATPTPPPAAPVFASVVIESVEEAARVRSCAFVSVDPSASAACVESSTRLIATDAPNPEPVTPAVALA